MATGSTINMFKTEFPPKTVDLAEEVVDLPLLRILLQFCRSQKKLKLKTFCCAVSLHLVVKLIKQSHNKFCMILTSNSYRDTIFFLVFWYGLIILLLTNYGRSINTS